MRDVLVIGGGPTGSQVAFRLAGLGYSVPVVEQKTRLSTRPWARTLLPDSRIIAPSCPKVR